MKTTVSGIALALALGACSASTSEDGSVKGDRVDASILRIERIADCGAMASASHFDFGEPAIVGDTLHVEGVHLTECLRSPNIKVCTSGQLFESPGQPPVLPLKIYDERSEEEIDRLEEALSAGGEPCLYEDSVNLQISLSNLGPDPRTLTLGGGRQVIYAGFSGMISAEELAVELEVVLGQAIYDNGIDPGSVGYNHPVWLDGGEYTSRRRPSARGLLSRMATQIEDALENAPGAFGHEVSFDPGDSGATKLGITAFSPSKSKAFLRELRGNAPTMDAWNEIVSKLEANLESIRVFRVGPEDSDIGMYGYAVVGRAGDDVLAGILVLSPEFCDADGVCG